MSIELLFSICSFTLLGLESIFELCTRISDLFPVRESPIDRPQMRRCLDRCVHGGRLRGRGRPLAAAGLARRLALQLGRSEHHQDGREEEEAVEEAEEHSHREYLRKREEDVA